MKSKGFAPIIILVLIALAVVGYFGYKNYWPKIQTLVQTTPTSIPSATADPTANWKTYTNTKYGYSVEYPGSYLIGFYDVPSGVFNSANGKENQFDIVPTENDVLYNFFQVQVYNTKTFNKTLEKLSNDNYSLNENHFQTTKISNLVNSKFQGVTDYEYSYTGKAVQTLGWGGVVPEGTYKVIIFQKNPNIYAIYLKDNNIFNQILSTFKFTQ